jgi:hypothetical protein
MIFFRYRKIFVAVAATLSRCERTSSGCLGMSVLCRHKENKAAIAGDIRSQHRRQSPLDAFVGQNSPLETSIDLLL